MGKVYRYCITFDCLSIDLEFSDGSTGDYDLTELISRDTDLVRPLANPTFFSGFFLELGALRWRNGFELTAASLHRKLAERGGLRRVNAA
jgi:hypothetical protein